MKTKYTVLYVDNCTPSYKEFDSAKDAKKFAKSIASADKETQDNIRYLTGLVVGEYIPANMDYKEKDILKHLKTKKEMTFNQALEKAKKLEKKGFSLSKKDFKKIASSIVKELKSKK